MDASLCQLQIPDEAATAIMKYIQTPKNMLVFCGSPGLGKTHFCAALTDWTFDFFNTRRYHKEEALLKTLREGISEGMGDYLTNLRLLIDDEVVILDDVGSGTNPDKLSYRDFEFRREVFFSFLDYRYNQMLPTIITSNFSKEDFLKIYSERIVSRLFAAENTIIQLFGDGLDRRKEGI